MRVEGRHLICYVYISKSAHTLCMLPEMKTEVKCLFEVRDS